MEPDATHPDELRADYLDASTSEHIIAQIQRVLDAEVAAQNRTSTPGNNQMREISSMASVMRDAIVSLRQKTLEATTTFKAEVNNSHVNIDKVRSLTGELKAANLEVEEMLGESGSNFTPTGSDTSKRPVDSNGVWVNPDAKK